MTRWNNRVERTRQNISYWRRKVALDKRNIRIAKKYGPAVLVPKFQSALAEHQEAMLRFIELQTDTLNGNGP